MTTRPLSLGRTQNGRSLILTEEERNTHLHVVGGSNRGKSKLLESLIRQDIIEGRGLCLIDPEGHLYEWLTAWCAEHNLGQKRRIILLDPHVQERVFGFNPLGVDGDLSSHAEAMQLACAQVWGGEDMRDMASLNMGLRAVFYCLAHHQLTLAEAPIILDPSDAHSVRRRLTERLPDPLYREVWQRYNQLTSREFNEQLTSTFRRLFEFIDAPLIRAIVGQRKRVIDFRACMDEGAIVLVNLQRSASLSEGKRRLLGTLIVNDLFQKAQARPQHPRPFTLYIDECYDYLNSDIARSIDRARKFGLRLVLSHQRLGQLEKEGPDILNAVMSIQSKILFGGLVVTDAEHMAREIFSGELNLNAAKKKFATPHVADYVVEWLQSESESRGASFSEGESETVGTGVSVSESASETQPTPNVWQSPFSVMQQPGSQSRSMGRTEFDTTQRSTSYSMTRSLAAASGRHQALRPVLRMGPGIPKGLDELIHEATVKLKELPKQNAILKPIGKRSVRFMVPTIAPAVASPRRVEAFVLGMIERSNFTTAYEEVRQELDARLLELTALPVPDDEPQTFREPAPETEAEEPSSFRSAGPRRPARARK